MRALLQRRIRTAMARLAVGVMAALMFGIALSLLIAGFLVWLSHLIGVVPTLLVAGLGALALALILLLISVVMVQNQKRIEQALREDRDVRSPASTGGREMAILALTLLLRLAIDHSKRAKTERSDG